MEEIKKAHEITDAHIYFVSLVDKAANKHKFIIEKQEEEGKGMNLMRSYTYGQARNVVMEQINELQKAVKDIDAAILHCNKQDEDKELTVAKSALVHIKKAMSYGEGLKVSDEVKKAAEEHYLHGIL